MHAHTHTFSNTNPPPPPPHHSHTLTTLTDLPVCTQEETEYVKSVGVTVELMNKNIFRELIFAESFMSSNLPLIIAQLR